MNETATGIPRIGDTAPDFKANTTQGEIQFGDWQAGKWVILFSHPADFTPVCSTELSEFARRSKEFGELETKLIGLSVDSIHSHMAWRENLRSIFDVEIGFPMIADVDMKVAKQFGMIHDNTSATATVRAVFVIDPKRTIRALVYYPMNVGRNIDEVKRLLQGLQTADKHACACPVDWKPGQDVVVPPPKSEKELAERDSHKEYARKDFYLRTRKL
jgi:peroxiredoxin (alkyl hydroperoxide reductase subunit C)